jgi:signal transduction histidine kinase
MNIFTRLALFTCLLVAVGATALALEAWIKASPVHAFDDNVSEADTRFLRAANHDRETLLLRTRFALGVLALAAITAITFAAVLPTSRPRQPNDPSARAGVELLARTAATQSAALDRERNVRQRTEENLALEQMRAGHAVADKIRLGRDLHDSIIQSLYATGLTLESAQKKISTDPARAAQLLDQGIGMLNTALRDVRAAVTGLSAVQQEAQNFPATVHAVLAMLGSGREATFDTRLDPEAVRRLGEARYADVLNIIRETVSNALRHGRAKSITVRLQEDQGRLALLVQDDGCGFDPAQTRTRGHGLPNLRARVELLRGVLNVTSQPGAGTRIVLTFPSAESELTTVI